MARRRRTTLRPTTATDSAFFRASRAKARSMRAKTPAPSRGQANAEATAIPVNPHSMISSEGLGVEAKGSSIMVRRRSMKILRRSLRFYGKIRETLPLDSAARIRLATLPQKNAAETPGRAESGGGGCAPALLSRKVFVTA